MNPRPSLSRFVHFSFVILTTLGYADVSPSTPVAWTLAYLEAVVGQLYLSIPVAALVAMQLSKNPSSRASTPD